MKKMLTATAVAGLSLLLGTAATVAQDNVVYVPVDIFACKYNDGKSEADLDAVVEKWNAYMDDNEADDYAAWTMTKHYANAEQEFDVAWLGAHRNGASMGAGMDNWIANGGEVAAEFGAVMNCDMSGNYASRMYKAPPDGNVPDNGVLEFANCKLKEGASYEAVAAATAQWAEMLGEAGSQAALYHWYPIYGTGENDLDWKAITSYPSHTELGKDYDRMGNEGLYWKKMELLGELSECDVGRVYNAKLRRTGKIRE